MKSTLKVIAVAAFLINITALCHGKASEAVFDSLYVVAKKQWVNYQLTATAEIAVQFAITEGSVEHEAKARYLLGFMNFHENKIQASLTNLLISRRMYQRLQDSTMITKAQLAIAGIYIKAAEYDNAIFLLRKAQELPRKYHDSTTRLITNQELGRCYANLSQFDSANYFFTEAEAYTIVNEERAMLINLKASNLIYSNTYQKAIMLLDKAKELPNISEPMLGYTYRAMGAAYGSLDNWQNAIGCNEQAMKYFVSGPVADYSHCAMNLAKAYAETGEPLKGKQVLIRLRNEINEDDLPPEIKGGIAAVSVEIEGLLTGNSDLIAYAAGIAQEAQASKGIAEKLAIERAKRQVEQGEHAFEMYAAEQKEKQLWKRQLIYWGLAGVVLVVIGLLIYRKYRAMDKKMLHLSLARKLTASGEAYRIPKDWDLKV